VEAFLAAFSIAYAVIVVKNRGLDMNAIRRANTIPGLALAAALLLVHTPLLAFHRIATHSQAARLLANETSADDFDALYLRFELGQYGNDALAELKTSALARENPVLKQRIDAALAADNRWSTTEQDRTDLDGLRARFATLPGTELEDDFLL